MNYRLRLATQDDVPAMALVELAAAQRFDDRDVAPDRKLQTLNHAELACSLGEGSAWIAQSPDDTVVGFVAATTLDNMLFILELDVLPIHQGRGVGTSLLDAVATEAQRRGLLGVSLTTFTHLPWNGPFYERRGFKVVPDDFLLHLANRLCAERLSGLQSRRAMIKHVAEQPHGARRDT